MILNNALERFRKRWLSEYLLVLREKHYNLCAENPSHHIHIGQLVTVKHENIHRIEWPLGVITIVYPDERGIIRTVEVEESGQRYLCHAMRHLRSQPLIICRAAPERVAYLSAPTQV